MMFGKKEPPLEVIIGTESNIKGDLTTRGVVKLDGIIEGRVKADWLIVGEAGRVKGEITSRGVVVYGKIEGSITTTEITDIRPDAAVEGDIYTTKLIVSEGAFFDGRSHMKRPSGAEGTEILPLEKKVLKGIPE